MSIGGEGGSGGEGGNSFWRGGGSAFSVFSAFSALLFGHPRPGLPQNAEPHRVVPVVFVPADYPVDLELVRLNIQSLADVREWYRRRLGGVTFTAEPMVVQRSRHTFVELAGADFQNWWPLPDKEFADYGLPWNRNSRIKLLLLARGAGAWAGADSENGGIDSIARAGRATNGALGGLAVIGDSSGAAVLTGICPRNGEASHRRQTGGTAWWCNWNTYRGTIAHELGHTWGLPHPDSFREGFRCDSTVITNMQCHWAWPADSLLPFEATHLRSLPGFGPAPDPILLSEVEPREGRGAVKAASLLKEDSLLWLPGRGGGTGYPWSVTITVQSSPTTVSYDLPEDCHAVAMDVGRTEGERGDLEVVVALDGREAWRAFVKPGSAPLPLRLPCVAARRVTLTITGLEGAMLGLGNPRIEPEGRD